MATSTAVVFDVVFPDQRSLGLHVLPVQLSLLDPSLPMTQVYGCQVTRSSLSNEVMEGDILVSINGIALLSGTEQAGMDQDQTILGTRSVCLLAPTPPICVPAYPP